MNIYPLFLEMKRLPKGVLIERPYELLTTSLRIPSTIQKIIGSQGGKIAFTRLSLKHLTEKGDLGDYLFHIIPQILQSPDSVYQGSKRNRFLLSKQLPVTTSSKPHTVTIEVCIDKDIIITSFIGKYKYFKNLKLLWGTTFSPSQ